MGFAGGFVVGGGLVLWGMGGVELYLSGFVRIGWRGLFSIRDKGK